MRVVDALPAIRSSRYDLPLTTTPATSAFAIGDVVRVPLGSREVIAFVVRRRTKRAVKGSCGRLRQRVEVRRAFDETGLALAEFVAEHYLCTLGEALGAVVLGGAVPRIRDCSRVRKMHPAQPVGPRRLLRLIWEEFADRFGLEQFLRHPEARQSPTGARSLRTHGSPRGKAACAASGESPIRECASTAFGC